MLVGCVKSKQTRGAVAKDPYTSDYFVSQDAGVRREHGPMVHPSAEHGLVSPDTCLETYDCYLPDTSRDNRVDWGHKVATQLEQAIGQLDGVVIDIHAGAAYVESDEAALRPTGAVVIDQLKGLSFGRRLAWYLERGAGQSASAQDVLELLRDRARVLTLDDLLASKDQGLRSPGLRSWWVDEGQGPLTSAGAPGHASS